MTKQIPEATTAVVAAEEAATRARAAAARAEAALEVASSDHAAAASLVEDADTVTRLAAEAEALRAAVATLERSFATTGGLGVFSTQQTVGVGTNTQQTVGTQRGAQTARSVSAIGADVEDAELRRAALERERGRSRAAGATTRNCSASSARRATCARSACVSPRRLIGAELSASSRR